MGFAQPCSLKGRSIPPAPPASSEEQGGKQGHVFLAFECLCGAAERSKCFARRTVQPLATFTSSRYGYCTSPTLGICFGRAPRLKSPAKTSESCSPPRAIPPERLGSVPAQTAHTQPAPAQLPREPEVLKMRLNSLRFPCPCKSCARDSYVPIRSRSSSAGSTVNGTRT